MDELKMNLLTPESGSNSVAATDGVAAMHAVVSPGRTARVRDFTIRGRQRGASDHRHDLPAWMYPPDGETKEVRIPIDSLDHIRSHMDAPAHKLGEWPSTAICGNDILASVLYSSGIVAGKAGKLMPLTQVLVAVVLYLFRYIYEEAVTAIPLNGGSYNVLLNTTSKRTAAVAATLGIISYLATGVVSGTSALQYLNTQTELPVVESTVVLLFAFAMLSIIGIAESSTVALGIFVLHVVTLSLLSVCSGYYAFTHSHVLMDNMKTDFPSVNVAGDLVRGNLLTAVFFGYSSAMLGITGFETSAQFVEEQAPGVFRKTLRNMWVFATFYNILLSCLSLGVLPLEGPDGIYSNQNIVLARMGRVSSGQWLERWVSIDAFVVLSGGVLTSYVGITGLVRRLAFDRVLPGFLSKVNACRGTNHYIILIFFVVQASLVVLLNADASILAGVFTFAFLGVMSLFAFGCMLLKLKREEIPRDVSAPWWSCIFGLVMVLLGLLGNLLGDPAIFTYFALYFIVFAAIMFLMLERVFMLRILLYVLQRLCPSRNRNGRKHLHTGALGGKTITAALQAIHLPPIVFFCKVPELSVLNKAILYVRKNEQTHNLRIVHVCDDFSDAHAIVTEADARRHEKQQRTLQDLHDMVGMFDLMYPKLKVDFVSVGVPGGAFDPSTVQWISQEMGIPTNMMFIRQPGTKHIHQVATLGVRVITGLQVTATHGCWHHPLPQTAGLCGPATDTVRIGVSHAARDYFAVGVAFLQRGAFRCRCTERRGDRSAGPDAREPQRRLQQLPPRVPAPEAEESQHRPGEQDRHQIWEVFPYRGAGGAAVCCDHWSHRDALHSVFPRGGAALEGHFLLVPSRELHDVVLDPQERQRRTVRSSSRDHEQVAGAASGLPVELPEFPAARGAELRDAVPTGDADGPRGELFAARDHLDDQRHRRRLSQRATRGFAVQNGEIRSDSRVRNGGFDHHLRTVFVLMDGFSC